MGQVMLEFSRKVLRFLQSEDGPTAVEYAVMLGLIVVVCLVAIGTVGKEANKVYDNAQLKTALQTQATP